MNTGEVECRLRNGGSADGGKDVGTEQSTSVPATPVGTVMRCSFCGKPRESVRRLIAGPRQVFICNECVDLCNEIMADGRQES